MSPLSAGKPGVRVNVPASSANLGPGFDVLALALDLVNTYDVWEIPTELRIEIQSVVAELARQLRVDDGPGAMSYAAALSEKAKLLAHARALKAADALRQALGLLGQQQPEQARQALNTGLALQQAVVARRRQALAVVQFSRASEAAVHVEQVCCAGEEAGLAALEHVIEAFEEALSRVSRRLAVLSRQAAADLRTERLAAAAGEATKAPAAATRVPSKKRTVTQRPTGDRAMRSPVSVKRKASTKAVGARRQAKRDSR